MANQMNGNKSSTLIPDHSNTLKPRRGASIVLSRTESTSMSTNELSFILAKNEGNALSAPNIPSHTNAHCVARYTPEPTTSPKFSSHPLGEALDLPQRPAPAQIHCYPPTRDVNRTSGNGPTVESPSYNGGVPQFRSIRPVGDLCFPIPPLL